VYLWRSLPSTAIALLLSACAGELDATGDSFAPADSATETAFPPDTEFPEESASPDDTAITTETGDSAVSDLDYWTFLVFMDGDNNLMAHLINLN